MTETGLSEGEAHALFDAADKVLPLAITMSKSGADRVHAELALKRADGKIELAVADLLRQSGL
jgi:N-acetylmuramic acid 6-phosphate (MurNAc-6-P) etherase